MVVVRLLQLLGLLIGVALGGYFFGVRASEYSESTRVAIEVVGYVSLLLITVAWFVLLKATQKRMAREAENTRLKA